METAVLIWLPDLLHKEYSAAQTKRDPVAAFSQEVAPGFYITYESEGGISMRRKDREVTQIEEQLAILDQCKVCRVALQDKQGLYLVPLNFGYLREKDTPIFYFHSANFGKKLDLIRQNPLVGFELDTKHQLSVGNTACNYSFYYQSIIGAGKISIVEEIQQKKKALQVIMQHYTKTSNWEFSDQSLTAITILKLTVTEMTCKEHQQPR